MVLQEVELGDLTTPFRRKLLKRLGLAISVKIERLAILRPVFANDEAAVLVLLCGEGNI